jgi:hypothetical protein
MSDRPLPGPLDEFLNSPPHGPEPASLRRELLLRTSALVRRRRLVRRLVAAASVAAAVLLTVLSAWIAFYRTGSPEIEEKPFVERREDVPIPPIKHGDRPVPPDDEKRPAKQADHLSNAMPPAVALEWRAFDAPAPHKTALYLQAGDRYVEDGRDLASAVRCYGQAVQTAQAKDLEIDPDDNWLVMALKLDRIERLKEK